MTQRKLSRGTFAFFLALLLSAAAQAQLFRTYLASDGSDANPCTLPAPCRLLPTALAAVADGGEIWMLDSANYNTGTVAITKSVTILAIPGALGSVVANSSNAIEIATAGVNVTLRNLVIVPVAGSTGGFNGVYMSAGAGLAVEKCSIAHMSLNGIYVTAAARIRVFDTTLSRNATGVWVEAISAGTSTLLDIAGATFDANANQGIVATSSNATATLKGSLHDSRVVQTSSTGVIVSSLSGATVIFSASNNIVADNGVAGLRVAGAGAKILASGNTATGNYYGLDNFGGGSVFESAGNNAVRNNTSNTSGTISNVGGI
jgi:hypothetical protein